MKEQPEFRIVAIGASAGGLKAVVNCLGGFIGREDAAFLVVLHGFSETPATMADHLAHLLEMPVSYAEMGMELRGGGVFVAPPNHHLMVIEGKFFLTNGPKENLFRPSIDVLFRSVAVEYGNQVIGVLLSGRLTDGTLGLGAIKRCGGITLIQDPGSADYEDMPLYAQRSIDPDFTLKLEDMAHFFNRLLDDPLPPEKEVPEVLRREVHITSHIGGLIDGHNEKEVEGMKQGLTCPSCGGPLGIMEGEEVVHYRCRTGHSFTLESLNEGQDRQLEETLWVALRVLDERLVVLKKMISEYQRKGLDMLARSNQGKLEEVEQHVFQLKKLMRLHE